MSITETLMDKLLESKFFKTSKERDDFTDDIVNCLCTSVKVLVTLNDINLEDQRSWRFQTNLMKVIRSMFELGLIDDIMPPDLVSRHHNVCMDVVKQKCPLPDRSRELSYIKTDTPVRNWWRRHLWAMRHLLSFIRVTTLSIDYEAKTKLHDDILRFCRERVDNYRPDKDACLDVEKTFAYYLQVLQFVEASPRFEKAFETRLFKLLCRYGPDENLIQESPVFERKFSNNHYIDHNLLKARIDFIDCRALSRHALRNLYTQPLVNHARTTPEKAHPILSHFFDTIIKQNDSVKTEVALGVLSLTFARMTAVERLKFNFPLKYVENHLLNLFNHSTKYVRARAMRLMTYWIDIPRNESRDLRLVRKVIGVLLKHLVSETDVTIRIEAVTCLYNFRINEQQIVDQMMAEANVRALSMELAKTFRFAPINTNATIILMALIKDHKAELAPIYNDMLMLIDNSVREMIQVDVGEKKELLLLALNFYAFMIEHCPDRDILVAQEVRIIDTLMIVHRQHDYKLSTSAAWTQERLNNTVISRTSRRTNNFMINLLRDPDTHFTGKPRFVVDDEIKRVKNVIKMIKDDEKRELDAALRPR